MDYQDGEWDRKWRLMVGRDQDKKAQNATFKEKMTEKKDLEEATECTFHPKIRKTLRPLLIPRRSKEELLRQLLPIIEEEEAVLRSIKALEMEERESKDQLGRVIASAVARYPDQEVRLFLDFYRDERLKEIANSKNAKLEIVMRLYELERKFNLLCSTHGIDSAELERIGFSLRNSKGIARELLNSIENHNTLKSRSRITAEFNNLLRTISLAATSRTGGHYEDALRRNSTPTFTVGHNRGYYNL